MHCRFQIIMDEPVPELLNALRSLKSFAEKATEPIHEENKERSVAQLVSVRLSELEVPDSILGDFLLICVA